MTKLAKFSLGENFYILLSVILNVLCIFIFSYMYNIISVPYLNLCTAACLVVVT